MVDMLLSRWLAALIVGASGPFPEQPLAPPPVMAGATDTLPIVPLSTSDTIRGFLRNVPGEHRYLRRVIRTEREWQAFWDTATVRWVHPPSPADPLPPQVDFAHEMLVVASDGMRRNYDEISIVFIERLADSLVVHVRTRSNLPKGCRLEMLWAPMAVVRVPIDSRPVKFVEEIKDERCGEAH